MAITIQTLDWKNHLILDDDDFIELVDEYMGGDAVAYISTVVNNLKEQADYTSRAIKTDLSAYEEEINSKCYAFEDIDIELDAIRRLIDGRLNRKELEKIVHNIKSIINNQI